MAGVLDPYEFLADLRRRWRVIAGACALAVGLTVAISLLWPKQYTATARILIEPPAGSDVRASVAVSPIYLESLRTYEHFAASDNLFQRALERFGLRTEAPSRSIESWKRRVLEVEIPRNTRILEIRVTLHDPRKAHELAKFLAAETVAMSRSVSREGDVELLRAAEQQLEAARSARQRAEAAWSDLIRRQSTAPVQAELESLAARRFTLERALASAEAARAENPNRPELEARVAYYRSELGRIEEESGRQQQLLAARMAERERLEAERKLAEAAYEAAEARVRDARAAIGLRGERLTLVDPGIVPEKPSFPNLFVNVLAALVAALVFSLLYLSLRFGYETGRPPQRPAALRLSAHDD